MSKQEERDKLVKETTDALKRMQDFRVDTLARTEELGRDLNFQDAVPHALKIVELFKQVAVDVLPEFSTARLNTIKEIANSEFNRFDQIQKFSVTSGNPKNTRDSLINQLENGYDNVFEQLWPAIAYSVRRSTDFARLEREARASIQSISDRTTDLQKSLEKNRVEAEGALDAIRKVAAEQGVSQQAIYFKEEADHHSKEASTWLKITCGLTSAIILYAVATLFLHKWEWLTPANGYEAAQLVVSKVLIFSTLVFFLVLAARNYMSHRHNAIVNRHRQNSLVTYRALVEAAGDHANRDIVLTKAAESIFGAEVTGFVKKDGGDGGALSMVNVTPALVKSASTGGS